MEHFHSEAFPDPFETTDERSGLLRFLFDVLETLALSVILFLAINQITARIRVDGYSMEPTIHTGEWIIVNRLSYEFNLGDPQRGDIIVFQYPRNPEQEYIKRVIGLPGDEITVRDGEVYVNGEKLNEPYIKAAPAYQGSWTVPDDSLFVFGDNRNNSSDSHNWGEVPMDLVIGKAIFVYWPPTEWGLIEGPSDAMAAP